MQLSPQSFLALIAFVGILAAWIKSRQRRGLPPGPPAKYPWIGTPLKVTKGARWHLYTEWAKKYGMLTAGDVMHFTSYGRDYVVLNTYEAARDLLSLRTRIYSDRPKMTMARELVGYDNSIALADSTPRTAFMRKAVQTELSPKNLPRFHGIQFKETGLMLGKLLDNPEGFLDHVRIMMAYTVFEIAYGHRPQSDNDELLIMIKKMMEDFSVFATPGNFLVDIFPILKYLPEWFPGASFRQFGSSAARRINAVCQLPYDRVKERKVRRNAGLSVTATFLEMPGLTPEKEHMFRWASEAVYAAGSDTTVSSIYTFMMCMARNIEVQKKAQAELDSYLGPLDRLPTFEDRDALPYIDKILWEVFRWYPVVPLALPHRVNQDDVYQGYTIPKNTTVVANLWNIMHDEVMYPDPWAFNPDRYGSNADIENSINQDPRKAVFGFGRRTCPGQHLAEASLWLAISNILLVYDIRPARDTKTGEPVLPPLEFTPGALSKPLPFKVDIKPRSAKAEALIRATYKTALEKIDM
ncbi:hypothetical protein FOMPIDRAFT_62158 [Fomitopsis schrenkii]|uniref:Cytochrome P450 n=1 Tax=Fomitopsis schrenkii TaxID=2126942 RepID=S8ESQ7_FOMSC|nr:hypothetical protein FOMPIDRAFT_62158 [Fomitopsis schrenkii]